MSEDEATPVVQERRTFRRREITIDKNLAISTQSLATAMQVSFDDVVTIALARLLQIMAEAAEAAERGEGEETPEGDATEGLDVPEAALWVPGAPS